jgi:hypothetical protein
MLFWTLICCFHFLAQQFNTDTHESIGADEGTWPYLFIYP